MATAVWTGSVSFGLVSIPVKLYTATSSHNISFNLLHGECKGRINLQNFCPQCERVVERSELVKGYQYEKNQYVIVDEEDLRQARPESSVNLEIEQFIELNEVDPIYFSKTYYLGPDRSSDKAFALLARAMEDTNRAAIGKLIMRNHEYLALIRPGMKGLLVHFMLYADELRKNEYEVSPEAEFRSKELDLAKQLIDSLSEPFDPEKYRDEYTEKVEELIRLKMEGRTLTIVAPKTRPKVIDLMEALQKSVEQARVKRPPARAETSRTARTRARKAR